jgi:hypothetical protein
MNKLLIIKKNDLSIAQSNPIFYSQIEAQGLIINPSSGATSSYGHELPFTIQSTNASVPLVQEEFCLVSRVAVNLTEQHVNEKEATLDGNDSVSNPQKALRENHFIKELKGKNG